MNTPLIILNILLTISLIVIVLRQRGAKVARRDEPPLTKPIHHPRIEGPTTSRAAPGIGYWRPKDEPTADPILACWYEKDTTPDRMTGFDVGEAVIPADTYVDLTGRRIPGPKFRAYYDPAEEVMVVSKVKPRAKLRNTNLVSGGPQAAQLSPEEEDKLAEEYELGGHVSETRR